MKKIFLFNFLVLLLASNLFAQESKGLATLKTEEIFLSNKINLALKEFKLTTSIEKQTNNCTIFWIIPANFSCWNPMHMKMLRSRYTF